MFSLRSKERRLQVQDHFGQWAVLVETARAVLFGRCCVTYQTLECFIAFSNTENIVKNTACSGVFFDERRVVEVVVDCFHLFFRVFLRSLNAGKEQRVNWTPAQNERSEGVGAGSENK